MTYFQGNITADNSMIYLLLFLASSRGCRGRDRMVVGFTTTCGINAYDNLSLKFGFSFLCSVLMIIVCPFGHCIVCPFIYGF